MRSLARISPMKTTRKSHSTTALALALAGLLAVGALSTPTPLRAQAATPADAASQKMQIMVQAIDARSSGDYAKARELFAQLLAMDPQDATLTKDVADMDAAIAAKGAGKPTVYDQAATATPATTDTVAVKQVAADTTSAAAPAPEAAPAASTTPAKPGIFARLGNAIGLGPKSAAPATADSVALKAQEAKQKEAASQAGDSIEKAKSLIAAGQYDDARTLLDQTAAALPQGLAFNPIRDEIKNQTAESWFEQAEGDYKNNQNAAAQTALNNYVAIAGSTASSDGLQKALNSASKDPWHQDINAISPNFENKQDKIAQLLVSGRAQYLYGDNQGALQTFDTVLINDPDNMEAKAYSTIINTNLSDGSALNQKVTRSEMLKTVNDGWVLPKEYKSGESGNTTVGPIPAEIKKMQGIIIPNVNIDVPTPLDQVAATLKVLSEQYDKEGTGVNIKVYAPSGGGAMPKVTLPNLSNLSLDKLLTIACKDSGYSYTSEDTVISLRPGGSGSSTGEFETRPFALSEGTRTRLLGFTGTSGGDSSSTSTDPFAASGNSSTAAPAPAPTDSSPAPSDIEDRLQSFFVRAGIDFPAGSKLAFAAGKIYVTNTPHNLDALGSFLYKYNEVKQVEIEARFLDVTQGKLQEAGARWNVSKANNPNDFLGTYQNGQNGPTANNLRSLGNAFPLGNSGAQPTQVVGLQTSLGVALPPLTIQQAIPSLPNSINVGTNSSDMFSGVLGILDGYKVQLILDMLDQQQGADLMSAPHITVLSQKDAKITVAQVLRYPQTFTSIQSQVSPANGNSGLSGGSGGVTITAGTPQDFVDEQIGVVMDVIPTVEEDDSITMHLEPKVTEFEGFIEYGGTSIAIQSGTTATVPSGFIQPIFDVRHIMTDVTIFDGATVVMGGLTRDEVKTVDDKVPVLGDIPLLGRMFRSKGESSEKRNLMIFVSANLISPGGSPSNQSLPGVAKGSVYSNPTIVTPSGSIQRVPENALGAPATPAANQ